MIVMVRLEICITGFEIKTYIKACFRGFIGFVPFKVVNPHISV